MLSVRIPRICLECQPQRKQRPETPDLLPPAGPDPERSRPLLTGQHFALPQTVTGFPAGYELSLHFGERNTQSPRRQRAHLYIISFLEIADGIDDFCVSKEEEGRIH